jgi:two-component sensor histidine kinase/PAS domain-containing protein
MFASGPEVTSKPTSKPASAPGNGWDSVLDQRHHDNRVAPLVLDTDADADFDRLTRLAASLFEAPIALISLIDSDQQRFKSCYGFDDVGEMSESVVLCSQLIAKPDQPYILIEDVTKDSRFTSNPPAAAAPFVRFGAAAPITMQGQRVGALCVLAPDPREGVDRIKLDQLVALAETASLLFGLKEEARAQARTAAALVKEEWRHALTLEAGKVGSWVWDVRTGEVVVSDILRRMLGIDPADKVTIDDILSHVHSDDLERVRAQLQAAFDVGSDYDCEFRVEGSDRWLIGRGRVYQRDGEGKPLIMMGINIDITETRIAADHTKLLLRELNHRVKNTLAMIQSIARQTVRSNPDPRRFIDAFSGRLRTLSDAHAILSDRDWSGIHLLELIDAQVGPHVLTTGQLSLSGADVDLPPDHALGLGLILHELSSNAAKFGALSRPEGRVRISWVQSPKPDRRISLSWKESNGPVVSKPAELGFGGKLIERSLAKVLDSSVQLSFASEGVAAEISFPLNE